MKKIASKERLVQLGRVSSLTKGPSGVIFEVQNPTPLRYP
jgi:hypothetical protein